MPKEKVFISHAASDKLLADAMAQLIEAGIGLSHNQIFCTSLAGQGIPAGKDFKEYIHDALANSVIVIALLTPNYYASAFCLCELGGTWMLSKDFLPFVTPLAGFGDMKAVLKGIQALRIDEDTGLDEMRDKLNEIAAAPTPTPRWSVKKSEFLSKLPTILKSLPKPDVVTQTEFKKLTSERDGYVAEVSSLEQELANLTKKYKAIGKLKDKAEVNEIELNFSNENEKLEALEANVVRALKPLSTGVEEALFHHFRGEEWHPDEDWTGRLDDDIERGLLSADSDGISVNTDHPKMRPALAALRKLEKFVDKASPDFASAYEAEHEDELRFNTRGFWERHITG